MTNLLKGGGSNVGGVVVLDVFVWALRHLIQLGYLKILCSQNQ